jgi:RES domain
MGETVYRVHPDAYGSVEFNPSSAGNARFSPPVNAAGGVIPTLYAGTTLDCALMETVFHDVPFVSGPKMWSKATHVAGKVWSQLTLTRDLALIDLSAVPLHKLGISRKDLIECDGSQYPETRAWALALHDQYPSAEGLTWTSRQADPARALVLFEDHLTGAVLSPSGAPNPLLLSDGSAILEILVLAQRLGVLLTP